jgi:hypothetical protein
MNDSAEMAFLLIKNMLLFTRIKQSSQVFSNKVEQQRDTKTNSDQSQNKMLIALFEMRRND